MQLSDVPSYVREIQAFTPDENRKVMVVREGTSEDALVEGKLRDIFIWAILSNASDVHISGHGDRQKPTIDIAVRTPRGIVNLTYDGANGKHFEAKMFQLTATPQGGSTPDMLSTRFAIALPAHFARERGLQPRLNADGRERPYLVSLRVEYIRTYDGFSFVSRLLDQQRTPGLQEIGLSYALLRCIERALEEPSGLILVSGPTGSGKTTLLNALIGRLNDGQRSIVTIENPVEYHLEGTGPIKQIEVRGEITFARALRGTLRLDPDVILVGEIRDKETMEVALQAAQTGHLVFATLHANSGPETLSRALDLTPDKQRDAYRLAETVKLVLAQRLLDRYEGVSRPRAVARDEAAWLEANGMGFISHIDEVTGTHKCGKAALVEALSMTASIKNAIRADALDSSEIYRLACDQMQYETLAGAGVRAVQGLGCRLRDCMTRLESTTDAQETPGLRPRLAREHQLSLAQVAEAIDVLQAAEDEGRPVQLADCLQQAREAKCAVASY